MENIDVPEEQVLLRELSSVEILALINAFANIRNRMDQKSVTGYLRLSQKRADRLAEKLHDALALAHRRRDKGSRASMPFAEA
jgi:hypothetical protein